MSTPRVKVEAFLDLDQIIWIDQARGPLTRSAFLHDVVGAAIAHDIRTRLTADGHLTRGNDDPIPTKPPTERPPEWETERRPLP